LSTEFVLCFTSKKQYNTNCMLIIYISLVWNTSHITLSHVDHMGFLLTHTLICDLTSFATALALVAEPTYY
jgi:hypothetical protein